MGAFRTCAETARVMKQSIMRIIVSTLCIVLICAAAAEESSDDGYSTEFVVPEKAEQADASLSEASGPFKDALKKETHQLVDAAKPKLARKSKKISAKKWWKK